MSLMAGNVGAFTPAARCAVSLIAGNVGEPSGVTA